MAKDPAGEGKGNLVSLTVFNTFGRRLVEVAPIEAGHVRMYTCGPTVYNAVHIGNLRTFLWEDVVRRHVVARGWRIGVSQPTSPKAPPRGPPQSGADARHDACGGSRMRTWRDTDGPPSPLSRLSDRWSLANFVMRRKPTS